MNSKIKILEEELERKDKIIIKLQEENAVLMKMSLRNAEEKIELKQKIHELQTK